MNDQLIEIILGAVAAVSLGYTLYTKFSQDKPEAAAADLIADGDFDNYVFMITKVANQKDPGDTTGYILRKINIAQLSADVNTVKNSCAVTDYPIGQSSSVYITASASGAGVAMFSDATSTQGVLTYSEKAPNIDPNMAVFSASGAVQDGVNQIPINRIGWIRKNPAGGQPIIGHLDLDTIDSANRRILDGV